MLIYFSSKAAFDVYHIYVNSILKRRIKGHFAANFKGKCKGGA